ncbi:MAG: hypothetical protein GX555_09320 [Actinomycetales bacterium]|nr:hypothetical protein [Actinomycetales bacterium]
MVRSLHVTSSTMRLVSEPAIYGVVLVAGLVVVVSNSADASWDVLVKVLATLLVFWSAHVYAGAVSRLGGTFEQDAPTRARLGAAVGHGLTHSWGMLMAGLIPLVVLSLGVMGLVRDSVAIWGTLWTAVVVLGLLGWLSVASWSSRPVWGLVGAVITSALGVVLILLKAVVY